MTLVGTKISGPVLEVTLQKGARHNSLDDVFLAALRDALEQAGASDVRLVVLAAEGRSFSTGGDIRKFLEHATREKDLAAYAERVVTTLNDVILKMVSLPKPVLCAVNGAVTGGALGLVLAADHSVMCDQAFIQPYYGEVGFAPDGGWTALLPARIGAGRTYEIIGLNRRLSAAEACTLGIVGTVSAAASFEAAVESRRAQILSQDPGTLAAAKALLWNRQRLAALEDALEAEKNAFVELIRRPIVARKMGQFLDSLSRAKAVSAAVNS